jgi:predicted RNase H-like HicB family nuclease
MSENINVEYTTQIWQEGDQFVAHAMPLDVMSSGKTLEEARQALAEAIQLFLITAADIGTLDEVLQEAGYELRQGNWVSPAWVAIERQAVTVGV